MVKIPVVDENDIVIAYKDREDTDTDIIRVSALWIISPEGRILLARRSQKKKHDPGKWSVSVGGTIEEDETYEANIKHEVNEELGITNLDMVLGPKIFMREIKVWAQIFFSTVPENTLFHLQKEEVAETRWFEKRELKKYYEENPDLFATEVIGVLGPLYEELDRRGI